MKAEITSVDRNIPVDTSTRSSRWEVLHKMEVGESFLILADDWRGLRSAIFKTRSHNKRFTLRQVSWNAYRCWRIS